MKIIQFNAENVKNLKAIEIRPNGELVPVCGDNGAGKTSVLDSIWFALGGKEALKGVSQPIRKGQKSAKVRIDFGDMVVQRSWTEKDTYLTVTTKDGAKYPSPQAMLDTLVGRLSFDPLAFSNMDNGSADGKRKQREELIKLVDLNIDLLKWSRDRQDAVDSRAMLGRNVETLKSQLKLMGEVKDDVPAEEISIAQLTEEFKTAQDKKAENDKKRLSLETKRGDAQALQQEIKNRAKTIDSMRANLKELDEAQIESHKALQVMVTEGQRLVKEVEGLQDPDVDAITKKMSGAEESNRMVRIKSKRKEISDSLEIESKSYDIKTTEIEALDNKKSDALKSAKFPISGLSFNDDGVLYKDIPFSQCSAAERLKVSLSIAMAMNPKVRVIRITDGSLLDDSNLKVISDMAKEKDFQIWLETIHSDDPLRVIIEDGEIKQKGVKDNEPEEK
jgi:DNA repair exonuclease SbcCD ATPase subunit